MDTTHSDPDGGKTCPKPQNRSKIRNKQRCSNVLDLWITDDTASFAYGICHFFHPFDWFSTLMRTKFSEIGQNWPHLASFRAQNRHILKKSIAQASCGLMGIFIVFSGFGLLVVDSLTGVCAIFRHFKFLPIFLRILAKKVSKTTIFGHF